MRRPVIAGLAVLLVAWIFGPALAGPPLYDGVGFPDEPYRYVVRPAKAVQMPPPTSATGVATRQAGGGYDAIVAASAEQGPQVLVTVGGGTMTGACPSIGLTAAPAAPPAIVDGDPTWGNAYRVTLDCPGAAAARAGTNRVLLRAPDGTAPRPVMYYSAAATGPWTALDTVRIGNDNYQSPLLAPGFYVLVRHPSSGLPFGLDPIVALLVGVVLALAAVIVVIRSRHARSGARGADPEHS